MRLQLFSPLLRPSPFLSLPCTYQRPCTSSIPGREEGPLLAPLRPRLASNFFVCSHLLYLPSSFLQKIEALPLCALPSAAKCTQPHPQLLSSRKPSSPSRRRRSPSRGGEREEGGWGVRNKKFGPLIARSADDEDEDRGRVIPLLLLQTPTAAPLFLIACQQKNRTKKYLPKKLR